MLLVTGACGSTSQARRPVLAHVGQTQDGLASYYARRFEGRKTASGERYRHGDMTAAHRTLPFGTRVRVSWLGAPGPGRSVVVRINDRGPFGSRRRIIDLSGAAARRLGMIRAGVVPVRIEVLSLPPLPPIARRVGK